MTLLRRLAADEAGTVLTEFALIIMVYMTMVIGLIQVTVWAVTIASTQFAVWEGCHAGAAAYHPEPADGTTPGGLRSQVETGTTEQAAAASFAALDRIEEVLSWLPLTGDYTDLDASVLEEDVEPGEEGVREIVASVHVNAPVLVPLSRAWLTGSGGLFEVVRACRMRLSRFYSY